MPRIKVLKVPPQKFDFFTFESLETAVDGAPLYRPNDPGRLAA
jgi:hypothetical protein